VRAKLATVKSFGALDYFPKETTVKTSKLPDFRGSTVVQKVTPGVTLVSRNFKAISDLVVPPCPVNLSCDYDKDLNI
jgi:hypothetical protein